MAQLDIAKELLARGLFKEALDSLGDRTDSWEAHLLSGIALARLGKPKEAADALTQSLALQPECVESLLCLSKVQRALGKHDRALETALSAVALEPTRWEALESLGDALLQAGRYEEATEKFSAAVAGAPKQASLRLKLSQCLQHAGKSGEAEEQLRRAFELESHSARTSLALSAHYSRYGILGKSLEVLEAGLRKSPQNAALHVAIASAFTLIRNDGAAEQHYRRAIALSVHAKIPYALWLIGQGRNDEALTVYREIRQDSPRNGVAFYGIVQTQPGAAEDESLILEMRRLLEEPGLETASRMYLCYGLAKICEQQKNYQASMGYYDQANDAAFELQNASIRFDIERIRDDFRRVTACYEELVRSGVWGVSGPAPIFIVGMIRSGTTLLDQIISSHSQVANAGELRFWIEKSLWLAHRDPRPDRELLVKLAEEYLEYARLLAGEGQTFTDKMPLNYSSIGLIHRTLPDARFVHIRRHPVDTCLSIYTTYFGAGAEFYHHKANTVAYYREYLNAMNYWRSQIPQDRLLEIQYEELVAEPEPVVRKVIDFCGLPWDKACLHHEQNRSAISTPSRWQARQPVYKSSLERWRKYEPWLGEFAELLPPFAT